VFWSTGKSRAGHVALAVGGGRIASNDILRKGMIDIVGLGTISQKWGAKYLGWAPPFFGGRLVASVGSSSGSTSENAGNGENTQSAARSNYVSSNVSSASLSLSPALAASNITNSTYGGVTASLSSAASLVESSIASLMGGSAGVGVGANSVGSSASRGATSAGSDAGNSGNAWDGKSTKNPLLNWLLSSGLQGDKLRKAWSIAMRESGGRPSAFNGNAKTGDLSYGLYQINMKGALGPARRKSLGLQRNEQLLDPMTNIRAFLQMSKGATSFQPWDIDAGGYAHGKQGAAGYQNWYKQFPQYAHDAGLQGYSKGAWNLSNDETARVHKGEMILPASLAEVVRDGVRKSYAGQSSGGGKAVTINVYPSNASYAEAQRLAKQVKQILEEDDMLATIGGN
jgi:hypothetical protein